MWLLEKCCFGFFFFWLCRTAYGILVPWPGIKPTPPAVEAQSLNHWTTREVLRNMLKSDICGLLHCVENTTVLYCIVAFLLFSKVLLWRIRPGEGLGEEPGPLESGDQAPRQHRAAPTGVSLAWVIQAQGMSNRKILSLAPIIIPPATGWAHWSVPLLLTILKINSVGGSLEEE